MGTRRWLWSMSSSPLWENRVFSSLFEYHMLQSLDVDAWSLQVIRESLAADTLPSDSAEPSPEAYAELRRDEVLSKECNGDDKLFEVCVEYCGRYNDCCYPTGLATVVKACRGIIEEDPSMELMLLIRCITHHLCRHPKISLVRAVMGYFNVPDENTEAMEELVVTGLASACTTWKAALRLWASLMVSKQPSATVPLVAAAYVTEFGVTAGLEADDVGRLLRSAEAFRVPQTFVAQWDGSCDGDDGPVLFVDAKLVATVLQDEFRRDVRGKEDGQALEGLFGYSLSGHPIYDTGAPSSTSTDGHHFLLLDARGSDCVARCESQPVVESCWIQRTIQPKRRPTLVSTSLVPSRIILSPSQPTEDWMKELDELDDDNTTAAAEGKQSSEKAAEPKVEHIRKERPVVVHRLRGKFAITIDGDADYGK